MTLIAQRIWKEKWKNTSVNFLYYTWSGVTVPEDRPWKGKEVCYTHWNNH